MRGGAILAVLLIKACQSHGLGSSTAASVVLVVRAVIRPQRIIPAAWLPTSKFATLRRDPGVFPAPAASLDRSLVPDYP